MATFTGQLISATYDAILKSIDNDPLGSVAKQITDGLGNVTPLYISTTQIGIGITPTEALHVSGNIIGTGTLNITGLTTFGTLKSNLATGATIGEFITEAQGIASNNNDTTLPTSAAVKNYVDSANTGQVTGSGTGGKLPIWTGVGASTTLSDSAITEESTRFVLTKDIFINDVLPVITLSDSNSSGSATSGDIVWIDSAASQRAIISLTSNTLGITSKQGGLAFNTASTPAMSIDASQNAIFNSDLDVTGDLAVNTDKFTVDAANGNVLAAGKVTAQSAASDFPGAFAFTTVGNNVGIREDLSDGFNVDLLKSGLGYVNRLNINSDGNSTFSGYVNATSYKKSGYNLFGANGTTLEIAPDTYWQELNFFTNGSPRLLITNTTATFAGDVTVGSTGAGSDKILNILTGGSDSTIKLMEAGTVYGFSQVYSGANNQFYIKRHSNSATGSAVITLNRDDDNATFTGNVGIGSTPVGNPATKFLAVGTAGSVAGGIQLWAASSQTHYLQFGYAASGGNYYRGAIGYAHASDTLLLLQSGSTALSFTGSQAATFTGDIIANKLTTSTGLEYQVRNTNGSSGNHVFKSFNTTILTLDGATNASTFAGDLTIDNSSPEFYLTPDSAKYSWMIAAQENVDQHFEITPSTTVGGTTFNAPALKINGANSDATFAGMITVNGGGIDIDNDNDIRLRFDNASTFYAGLEVATTAGDMIATTAVNDFAIRSTENMLFATGGNVERMRIRESGTIGIGAAGYDSQMLTIAAGTLDGAIYATSTDANCFASFRDNSSTANIEYGAIGNNHVFRKDASEQMRIDSSGNVGIGTDLPNVGKVQIKTASAIGYTPTVFMSGTNLRLTTGGTAAASITTGISMAVGGNAEAYIGAVQNSNGYADIAFQSFNGSYAERMRIKSGGQINMGTSTNFHQFEPEADMDFNFIMNAGQINASPNYTIKSSTSGAAITSRLQLIGSTGNMTITGSLTQNGSISDISLKENIKPVENALDKIEKLNAVTFDWKKSDSILQLKEDYGFIAQEVEKVIPEIVRTNDDDKKAINYNGITSVLVKAIQELTAKVERLEQECKCK